MKMILSFLAFSSFMTGSVLGVSLTDIPDPHNHSFQESANEAEIDNNPFEKFVLVANSLDKIVPPVQQGRERTSIRKTVPSPDGLFQVYIIVKSDGELYSENLYLEDRITGDFFKLEGLRTHRFINVAWATNRYLVFDLQDHLRRKVSSLTSFNPRMATLHYVVDVSERKVVAVVSYTNSKPQ